MLNQEAQLLKLRFSVFYASSKSLMSSTCKVFNSMAVTLSQGIADIGTSGTRVTQKHFPDALNITECYLSFLKNGVKQANRLLNTRSG